jgi:4-hydroxy-3-polyprenylbenzoate decarboxylase
MASRCDPEEDIDIIRKAWSGALDPRKKKGDNFNSRAIVDACRPYDWKDQFPPVAESSPELAAKTKAKWSHLLKK